MIRVYGIVRTVADPELKKFGESQVANFRVATDGRNKDDGSTFWNCKAWGHLAETVTRYGLKGKMMEITGNLSQRVYEKDGQKHTVDEIIVTNIELLGGANKSE